VIEISDNGKGFDINGPDRGAGIQNLYKRAHLIGAELSIHSAPGKGTTVNITINTANNE